MWTTIDSGRLPDALASICCCYLLHLDFPPPQQMQYPSLICGRLAILQCPLAECTEFKCMKSIAQP